MDLLEQIREALGRLAQLSAEELTTLKEQIGACFDDLDTLPTTAENVAILNELADAGEAVMARGAEIEAEAAAAEEAKESARARRAKLNGEAEQGEPEAPAEGEGEAEVPAEAGADLEPIAASGNRPVGSSPSRMAARQSAPATSPENSPEPQGGHLVASANMRSVKAGEILTDRYDLAEGVAKTLSRMSNKGKAAGDVILASAEWTLPDERVLTDDETMNARKIDAVCHPSALVATGGICAPVNVDYGVGTWAVADRPLRDGLPAFQATRGGLTFRTPPTLASLASSAGIWTEATDASPGGATKALEVISCPSPSTVYINAVTTRLGFGNMMGQFDPETIAANTDLAIAAAARKGEVELLTLIAAAATADVTTAAVIGATRDFLASLDVAAAVFRNQHRLSDNQTLTVIVPRWVKDLIRIDRARELAHDGVSVDPLAVPDAWIEDVLSLRNIKPIFTLESLPVNGAVYPAQDFVNFTASSAIPLFPAKMVWHMFLEGSIQFLDGGRLDLGVVRDSTLDATNDYETFVETFEGIANRSFAGGVVQFVSSLCANGQSGAAATVSGCP
jgi:hypothetical protein